MTLKLLNLGVGRSGCEHEMTPLPEKMVPCGVVLGGSR